MTDFECLVVEDCPPVPNARVPSDPRFRLIKHRKNKGVSAARNTGIRAAVGDFVTFLDDDDEFADDHLAEMADLVEPERVVVCARQSLDGDSVTRARLPSDAFDTILNGFTPHMGQTVIPRQLCPLLDENYPGMEDAEWWLRVAQHTPVRCTDHVGYRVRDHQGARTNNGIEARVRGSWLILDQYAEYFASHKKAASFRLERIARLEASRGNLRPSLAIRALALNPSPRTAQLSVALAAKKGRSLVALAR